MTKQIRGWIKEAALVSVSFVCVVASVTWLSMQYYQWQHPTKWAEYIALELANDNGIAATGDPIPMRSVAIWKKAGIHVDWNDILRCFREDSSGNGYWSYYSNHQSDMDVTQKRVNESPFESRWEYGGRVPKYPTTCKIQSQMTLTGPFNVVKRYEYWSTPFELSPHAGP